MPNTLCSAEERDFFQLLTGPPSRLTLAGTPSFLFQQAKMEILFHLGMELVSKIIDG